MSDAEVEVMLMGLYRKQYPELFNELELSWTNYLKENFPLFQNKKFNGYTDMLSGLTSQNTLVYNQSIRLI